MVKELGSGHLMTRPMQRGLRRNGVQEKRKTWGGVYHPQGRSLEKAVFRKALVTQRPRMSPGFVS